MLKTKKEIKDWLYKYKIIDYHINERLGVNVGGSINLNNQRLTEIPVNFIRVYGNFECKANGLTSLNGCPKIIRGNFDCSHNQLENLEGGPKEVFGKYNCSNNKLTSLKGCPIEIRGDFYVCRNELKDLIIFPKIVNGSVAARYNNFIYDGIEEKDDFESFNQIHIKHNLMINIKTNLNLILPLNNLKYKDKNQYKI